MTIMPVLTRELMVASRNSALRSSRLWTGIAIIGLLGVMFGLQVEESGWLLTPGEVSRTIAVAFQIFVGSHLLLLVVAIPAIAAKLITEEKEKRTFDFLLGSQLGNAEIVLGKFAALLILVASLIAPAIPIMTMFIGFGGIDYRLVLLTYLGCLTLSLALGGLGIFCGVVEPSVRKADTTTRLAIAVWFIGPMTCSVFLPRAGYPLPPGLAELSLLLLRSTPIAIWLSFVGMIPAQSLTVSVMWMCGLQTLGGLFFLGLAIVRVRSAYRHQSGVALVTRRRWLPRWIRARPPVGDDPIFWRERYTSRKTGFARWFDAFAVVTTTLVTLGATIWFAAPAFLEVFHHGYNSGGLSDPTGEKNPLIRLILAYASPRLKVGGAFGLVDDARTNFNLYLRLINATLTLFVAMMACSLAAESIVAERTKETWNALITTPLTSEELIRSKIKATLWRSRNVVATIVFLWILGLCSGAIHPLGLLIVIPNLIANTFFMVTIGMLISTVSDRFTQSTARAILPTAIMSVSTFSPIFLGLRGIPILTGLLSPSIITWIGQFSYRDLRSIQAAPWRFAYLSSIGLPIKSGLVEVIATCALGIVIPTIGGYCVMRYNIKHFDRLTGRPWRSTTPQA